jgi:hypothetical protein
VMMGVISGIILGVTMNWERRKEGNEMIKKRRENEKTGRQ